MNSCSNEPNEDWSINTKKSVKDGKVSLTYIAVVSIKISEMDILDYNVKNHYSGWTVKAINDN